MSDPLSAERRRVEAELQQVAGPVCNALAREIPIGRGRVDPAPEVGSGFDPAQFSWNVFAARVNEAI